MNLTLGGEGGPTRLGQKQTPETKEKIRISLMGHSTSQETRLKIGLKSKGRGKGNPLTQEHKAKLSQSKKGKPSPFKGIKRPPEV